MAMKECRVCHVTKPLDDFYKRSQSRSHHGDGHDTLCKECAKTRARTPERKIAEAQARSKRLATPEGRAKERAKARERYQRLKDDPDFKERCKLHQKNHYNTPAGREKRKQRHALFRKTQAFREAVIRSRAKHPEKRAAQITFSNAIAKGKIQRPSVCSVCGKSCVPHGHHPDYSQPLMVIWVCHQCHVAFHWGRQ
jgi:hypothetical protein